MSKLPEKFPEYSIMYRTLSKQIIELEERKVFKKVKQRKYNQRFKVIK